MTTNEKIAALELVEMDLCDWLDYATYIGDDGYKPAYKHYRIIEGVKNEQKFSFSFIFILTGAGIYNNSVVINAVYPRSEQILTVEQFQEWLKEDRSYSPLLQN